MRLSHITLSGFKSFAKKTSIEVTHNVTGIVGPNGSGKSNVAEAIRFVLGEQSIKSMRGKLTTDLLYKGSSQLSAVSKTTVSLVLDNKEKKHSQSIEGDMATFLVYDEITLSRTLYADGSSEYTINDAKVRLKDVHELLALGGIGSVGHLIISQGEADRVLMARPKERKELLEDALGLRIYHIRLKESVRKLDRTKDHMREVDLLRKEIAPQLSFLQREVNKLEKLEKEKEELARLYLLYAHYEKKEINAMQSEIQERGEPKALTLILESLEKEITREIQHDNGPSKELTRKREVQMAINDAQHSKDELARIMGRLEAEKAFIERDVNQKRSDTESYTIENVGFARGTLIDLCNQAETLLREGNVSHAKEVVAKLRVEVEHIFGSGSKVPQKIKDMSERLLHIDEELNAYGEKEKSTLHQIRTLEEELIHIEEAITQSHNKRFEDEKHKRDLIFRQGELKAQLREQELLVERYRSRKDSLELLEKECAILAGARVYDTVLKEHDTDNAYDRTATLRALERSKLRIEDAGVSNGADLYKEFDILRARDEYLAKELEDVKLSEEKLLGLIQELEQHINNSFTEGIKQVSHGFNEMFGEVFKGGKASVEIISETDDEGEVETGLDIKVSLPEKRVKDLALLSGGEKALTSIALSFAMSQIAPPPFMVLDETDAALDESNAKKYGVLLGKLAKNSKLLVITHNRETMSHCDMLYGITIGSDGASKLLSINFKDAEAVAK
jgi:chromosome segregation protein